jgi:hypothetical protein
MRVTVWVCGVLLLAATGCGQGPEEKQGAQPTEGSAEPGRKAMAMTVTSAAFQQGQRIPRKHTGEGEDVSPPLAWTGAPAETKEFALICDDPDAPTPKPWVHWVAYQIAAATTSLAEGNAGGALEGRNGWGKTGYRGPMPPPGHGVHRYFFRVYALDQALGLKAGASKEQLLAAMQGHLLAQGELMGTYERK